MALGLISAILLILLVLAAIFFCFNRFHISDNDDLENQNTMHTSGIYSIVRASPRENISTAKPSIDEISKYISTLNEDIGGNLLSEKDKEALITHWSSSLDENITSVETGDENGVEFYYYDFTPSDCIVCQQYLSKGKFVTREEIYTHPSIIPPFHIGCSCKLLPHHGKENLRETTEMGMFPFFKNQELPALPKWNCAVKL